MKIVLTIIGSLLIIAVLAIAFIPVEFVRAVVAEQIYKNASMLFEARDFKRALPFGFRAGGVKLLNASDGAGILKVDRLKGSPALISTLLGSPEVKVLAEAGEGTLESNVRLEGEETKIDLELDGFDLSALLFLKEAGLGAKGYADGRAEILVVGQGCPEGSLKFTGVVSGAEGPSTILFQMAMGESADFKFDAVASSDCRLEIKNLWIDSSSLDAEVNGVVFIENPVKNSRLDLTINIIEEKEDKEGPSSFIVSLLSKFKQTQGHYSMHLGGTAEKPRVSK